MDMPAETEGTPHTVFDSTGMVFAVMAQMRAGQGTVSRRSVCSITLDTSLLEQHTEL